MRTRLPLAPTVLLGCALSLPSVCVAQAYSGRAETTAPAVGADRAPAATAYVQDTMDPVMRAILFALVAKALREAAASPDPLAALGDSIEHALASAATNPQTVRTIEALAAQAFKDVPPELRQALLAFVGSTLKNARRASLEPPVARR